MSDTFQHLHVLLWWLLQGLHPLLVPVCFVLAWGLFGLGLWSVLAAVRDAVQRAKQMHQIPCANCQYFSGDRHLKCPVNPYQAFSEAAIGCADFESADPIQRYVDGVH
jgi:hypothetical protein